MFPAIADVEMFSMLIINMLTFCVLQMAEG
jgi:hypothetical protein